MSPTAREMLEAMPGAFLPDKAGDATARIQLDLTGEDGGAWLLDIAGGECNVSEEKASEAEGGSGVTNVLNIVLRVSGFIVLALAIAVLVLFVLSRRSA